MVKFIESELVSLKKEVNEMWTLVYNQLDRAGRTGHAWRFFSVIRATLVRLSLHRQIFPPDAAPAC